MCRINRQCYSFSQQSGGLILQKAFRLYSFLLIFLFSFISFPAFAEGLTLFTTEEAAQQHCPNDEVVWLNLPTKIWHSKGGRWYGNTKSGAFVCKEEAAAAGSRASLRG